MDKVFGFLSGYRTYIVAILLGVSNIGASLGWWTWEQAQVADGILAPFGLAFLRAGVDKAGKTNTPK